MPSNEIGLSTSFFDHLIVVSAIPFRMLHSGRTAQNAILMEFQKRLKG